MFNLLPENLKSGIKNEYRFRLAIIVTLFVIFSEVTFLIFLLPSWLVSNIKQKEYSGLTNNATNSLLNQDVSSTTTFIKSTNTILTYLNDNLNYPMMYPIVNDVLNVKKSSIKLDGIIYTVSSEKSAVLGLSGVAVNREALVSFSDDLRRIEYFKKVDLPISNFAKDKNINFTINIAIEK